MKRSGMGHEPIESSKGVTVKAKIAVLPAGDGCRAKIVPEAVKVLKVIAEKYGHSFEFVTADIGGQAIDKVGVPLPKDTLALAKQSDAVLLGAVGGLDGRSWSIACGRSARCLESAKHWGSIANLRPAKLYSNLVDASTLKREVVEGIDILVIRELTGGIYFGKPKGIEKLPNGEERGVNTEVYSTEEVRRIAKVAFEAARKQPKKVTSVDKANVLESSELVAQGGDRCPCVLSGCRTGTYLRG